jgi:meso-butanediol dehydrogenase/(S,S)-butanediol dehydrogenase/diacetyl reductase
LIHKNQGQLIKEDEVGSRMTSRTVIITGGAAGIGRGIAKALAAEGANTVIADLNLEAATSVADEITKAGGKAIPAQVDVTKRVSVAAGIELAVKTFGKLDCYFNNAGFNKPMKFLDVTEENFNAIMNVNALAVFVGTQEAAKQFIRQGSGGKVVNTASIAGRTGFSSFAPYSASKAAVISITQAAARALAEHNITVNAFSPGVVDTPLWVQLDKDLEAIGEGDSGFDSMAAGILVGRAAQPEDIAPTALFLASSDSDYVTGQTMAIDGGMILV